MTPVVAYDDDLKDIDTKHDTNDENKELATIIDGANHTTNDEANHTTYNGAYHITNDGANYATNDGVNHTTNDGANHTTNDGANHIPNDGANYTTNNGVTHTTNDGANYTDNGDGMPLRHDTDVIDDDAKHETEEYLDTPDDDLGDEVKIESEDQAPDGGWGWFIVLGAIVLRTVMGGLAKSHGLFYLKFKERYHGSATSIALVTSLTGVLRLSTGPLVSILTGRFRCRVLIAVGTVTLFLGLILTGSAPNLQFLYFSYGVVVGIGRSFALTPVPILLGSYFDKRRSLAFGLASAGFSIGGFAITPIVELLFQKYGYQGTFLILGGFTLNVFVSAALFRPIELHRKLTSVDRKYKLTEGKNEVIFRSLDQIESGTVLSSSTVSVNRPHYKSSDVANSSTTTSVRQRNAQSASNGEVKLITNGQTSNSLLNSMAIADLKENDSKTVNGHTSVKESAEHDEDEKLLDISDREIKSSNASVIENKDRTTSKLCCLKSNDHKSGNRTCSRCCMNREDCKTEAANIAVKKDGTRKLISWSILKNTSFLCFVFATFCFTLPTSTLFLPALAKTRGLTDIQAATLLSTGAGFDTLFRVLSGIILDQKVFRSIRPQIYSGVAFIQGIMVSLYPQMTSFADFMTLSAVDGAVQGIKNAQGSVIMMDMLGVDKLASSMAVTMSVQCVAVFLGPTISGQLIDTYGSYDEAFYFGAGAILLGGAVMGAGNIAKHYRNRRKRFHEKMRLKQSKD